MFDLENISVRRFFKLGESEAFKYFEIQSILKGKPVFGNFEAQELGQLTFGEVSEIKRNIQSPNYDSLIDTFKMVFGVKESQFLNSKVIDFFYALNWIRESIINLVDKEIKSLQGDPDPDLEMAGVKRLNAFGELSTLISIGQKFGKTPEEVESWKYNLVFSIMLYDKIHGEVEKNYNEIKKPNGRT